MADKHSALVAVRAAFGDNVHPGAAYLVGSRDGCEPEEAVAAFREETSWQQVDVEVLDAGSDALSFFSEAGFRFFLPAYLVADIEGALLVADPVFHLTQSFCVASVTLEAGGETFVKALGRAGGRNQPAVAVALDHVLDDGAGLGDHLAVVGDHRRLAQRMHRLERRRGEAGLHVAFVAPDLVVEFQLFEQPQDSL
jgi:hypothetical protein